MKKYLPFIFPTIAVLIVIFLAIRWYNLNTSNGQVNDFADDIEIESIEGDQVMVGEGVNDTSEAELMTPDGQSQGAVRYQLDDQKVKMTVMGSLPEITEGQYQVWLKQIDGEAMKKAFVLSQLKGGFIGSAAISREVFPFEVVVTKEIENDDQPEDFLLRAVLTEEEN